MGRERRTNGAALGCGKMAMLAAKQKKDFASEGLLGPDRKFFTGKTRRKIALFLVSVKSLSMVFVGENQRAGRSPPLINLKFHTIIISKHRAKTPRTKKKEKNMGPKLP